MSPRSAEETSPVLSLNIKTPKLSYQRDMPMPVQIEIQNKGEKEIWMALSLDEELGMPSNLPVWVRDASRRRMLPDTFVHQSEFGQRLAHESWVYLAPGYIYRRDVVLTRFMSSFLTKPGKYQISVVYQGLKCADEAERNAPISSGCPSSDKSKIFSGRTESNSLWVEVLPGAGHEAIPTKN